MCVARDKTGSPPAHDLPHAHHYHEFCKQARKATIKEKRKRKGKAS